MIQKFGAGSATGTHAPPADLRGTVRSRSKVVVREGTHCVARLLSLLARECPDYDCLTDGGDHVRYPAAIENRVHFGSAIMGKRILLESASPFAGGTQLLQC